MINKLPSDNNSKNVNTETLFPYSYRAGQKAIIDKIFSVLNQSSHLVMESGTGTGKTISALTPALCAALNLQKRIVYLTRTNSQQRQVLLELRSLNDKLPEQYLQPELLLGVGLQGRLNLCPLIRNDLELAQGTPEEMSKLCSDRKAISRRILKGEHVTDSERKRACKYFGNVCVYDKDEIKEWVRNKLPSPEELNEFCAEHELCAYEVNKSLVENALVITAPYIYVFNKFIRQYLLDWMIQPLVHCS